MIIFINDGLREWKWTNENPFFAEKIGKWKKKMRINDKNDTNSTVKVNSVKMKWNIRNAATNKRTHIWVTFWNHSI